VWIWIQSKCYGSATLVSDVIDTADHKKIDFIVEYLREFEAICKKALARGSGAQMELFDEKNRRSKISWQGPFNKEEKFFHHETGYAW
jgi:hypothetical protein